MQHEGETKGCRDLRKHISWYPRGAQPAARYASQLARVASLAELDETRPALRRRACRRTARGCRCAGSSGLLRWFCLRGGWMTLRMKRFRKVPKLCTPVVNQAAETCAPTIDQDAAHRRPYAGAIKLRLLWVSIWPLRSSRLHRLCSSKDFSSLGQARNVITAIEEKSKFLAGKIGFHHLKSTACVLAYREQMGSPSRTAFIVMCDHVQNMPVWLTRPFSMRIWSLLRLCCRKLTNSKNYELQPVDAIEPAREAPVAPRFRQIVSGIYIVEDISRMGALSVHIA